MKSVRTRLRIPWLALAALVVLSGCAARQGGSAGAAAEARSAEVGRGWMLLSGGACQEARAAFEKALAARPADAEALEGAGVAALRLGEVDQAVGRFREALKVAETANRRLLLGVALNRSRQPGEALAEFDRARELGGHGPELRNAMGVSRLMLGEPEQAAEHFRAALAQTSSKVVRNNLGVALYRLGRPDEALDAFARAGGKAVAHNNLGCLLLADGRAEEAAEHLRLALDLSPRHYAAAEENLELARLAAVRPVSAATGAAGLGAIGAGVDGAE